MIQSIMIVLVIGKYVRINEGGLRRVNMIPVRGKGLIYDSKLKGVHI